MKTTYFCIAFLGLVASANAQFSVSAGAGDFIPAGGTNTGSPSGFDLNGLDHDFTIAQPPGTASVAVPVAVTSIESIEIEGLDHTWCGDLVITLTDPAGVGHMIMIRPGLNGGTDCCGIDGDFGGTYTFVEAGSAGSLGIITTDANGDIAPGIYDQTFESGGTPSTMWPSGDENVFNTPMGCGADRWDEKASLPRGVP